MQRAKLTQHLISVGTQKGGRRNVPPRPLSGAIIL